MTRIYLVNIYFKEPSRPKTTLTRVDGSPQHPKVAGVIMGSWIYFDVLDGNNNIDYTLCYSENSIDHIEFRIIDS